MGFISGRKLKNEYVFYAIPLLFISFLLFVKISLVQKGIYTSDVYILYQMANDWLIDKPLYFENSYGSVFTQHTYYIIPFFAPFTIVFGVAGLFIANALLYLGAMGSWISIAEKRNKLWLSVCISLLMCGTFGFYIWDDPVYGWHVESIIFPLTIWAAAALYKKKKILAGILLTVIVLTREDGSLQAAAILAAFTWLEFTNKKILFSRALKRIFIFYGIASVLFFISMFILQDIGDAQRLVRAMGGFEEFFSDAEARNQYLSILFGYFSVLVLMVPFVFIPFYKNKKWDWAAVLFVLPTFLTGFVGGLYYFPVVLFSIVWPPRLSYSYSLILAVVLLIIIRKPNGIENVYLKYIPILVVVLSHSYFLYLPKFYPTYNPKYFSEIAFGNHLGEAHKNDIKTMNCIADKIPGRKTVLVDVNFAYYFSSHDFILCDAFINRAMNKPEIAVLRNTAPFWKFNYFSPVDSMQVNNIYVYLAQPNPEIKQALSKCN